MDTTPAWCAGHHRSDPLPHKPCLQPARWSGMALLPQQQQGPISGVQMLVPLPSKKGQAWAELLHCKLVTVSASSPLYTWTCKLSSQADNTEFMYVLRCTMVHTLWNSYHCSPLSCHTLQTNDCWKQKKVITCNSGTLLYAHVLHLTSWTAICQWVLVCVCTCFRHCSCWCHSPHRQHQDTTLKFHFER